MYFNDLNMMQMFRVGEYSRYLFLEFIPEMSLVVVANQGCYDLHVFRLLNSVREGKSSLKVQREYVFKCSDDTQERILGVSVQVTKNLLPVQAHVYIFTSFCNYHVLQIGRRVPSAAACANKKMVINPDDLIY
jgi:hypothetical protein